MFLFAHSVAHHTEEVVRTPTKDNSLLVVVLLCVVLIAVVIGALVYLKRKKD